jgi:hypothetical protein
MVDTLLGIGGCLGIVIVAIALLAWRDARRFRRLEAQVPVPVRIERIRDDAAFMAQQFQGILQRGPAERTSWVGPVLAYYRRLEALATEARPSAEQSRQLAEEAGHYLRQNRLKGLRVAQQAQKLANLAQILHDD